MMQFDVIAKLEDNQLQTLLQHIERHNLVSALHGVNADIAEKVKRNVSKKAWEIISDDVAHHVGAGASAVIKSQQLIINELKHLVDIGTIYL
jgi:flagellar motor switch protein FliG